MKMLITGGTKGIGLAVAKEFAKDYDVYTVGRSCNATLSGDLLDAAFLEKVDRFIFENNIDVLVNAVGTNVGTFNKINQLNYMIPGSLTTNFYSKMAKGYVFNITSNAANEQGQWIRFIPESEVYYYASKKALKALTNLLSSSAMNPNVKLISVEPALCRTEMVPDHDIREQNLYLIEPEDIAKIIRSTIDLPDRLQLDSIHITNKRITRLPK